MTHATLAVHCGRPYAALKLKAPPPYPRFSPIYWPPTTGLTASLAQLFHQSKLVKADESKFGHVTL